jgi:predicted amidohydrolase YtcJ
MDGIGGRVGFATGPAPAPATVIVMSRALTLANVRIPGPRGAGAATEIHLADGLIRRISPSASRPPTGFPAASRSGEVLDCEGRFAVPGLWDHHVHSGQWALARQRIDVSGAPSARALAAAIAPVAAERRAGDAAILIGYGFRDALWADSPTPALLDEATAELPAVMIGGDLHCAWLNSAALQRFGLAEHPTGVLREAELFAIMDALSDVPEAVLDAAVAEAARAAAARGVVGIVDFEMSDAAPVWSRRIASGVDELRVVCSVWTSALPSAIDRGRRTGDPVPGTGGLALVGPLKVITDGSMNTRTAYCDQPYPGEDAGYGILSVPYQDLVAVMELAWSAGIASAIHAIGDHANRLALNAFEQVGCPGSIEHAQLLHGTDAARMGRLGVVASVQPEHLLEDRDAADILWAGRTSDAYVFRSMIDAGVRLAFGSDAPVVPADPWSALSAAVFRSRDGREPWHPEQRISVGEALAASTNGVSCLRAGGVADIVLVERDPFDCSADELRAMPVFATFLGGRQTFGPI